MLNWAVKYNLPLDILCDTTKETENYKINENNWKLRKIVLKYLKPFKTLSDIPGGEKYCYISMVVIGINLLIDKIEQWTFELDTPDRIEVDEKLIISLNCARDKILKHYSKTTWLYCVALILDPQHKKQGFQLTTWGKQLEDQAIKTFEDIYRRKYYTEKEGYLNTLKQPTMKMTLVSVYYILVLLLHQTRKIVGRMS